MKKYDSYKASGIEWIGEIPSHWEVKRLKYVSTINDDTLSDKTEDGLEVEYVDISSIESGVGISKTESFNFKEAPSRARRLVKDGDIIVSTVRTYLKAIAKIKNPKPNLVVSTGFAVIRPRDILPDYAGHLFYHENLLGEIVSRSVGVSYPAINSSEIGTIKIPLPKKPEQTAIAFYLDRKTAEIDELIADKKRLLELYEEEKTAIINQSVTKGINPDVPMKDSGIEWLGEIPEHWEVKRLKYVAEITLGKMLTKNNKGDMILKPYLRAANLGWIDVDVSDVKEMWFSEKEIKKYRLNKNDLLVSEGGEVGRTCIWKEELEECYIQNSVHKLTVNEDCEPHYFLQQFYLYGKKGAFDLIVNRISIAHLTVEKLREVEIIVPPREEQQTLVHHIETECRRIDKQVERTKKLIELLKEYREALISEVVTGKIKVI